MDKTDKIFSSILKKIKPSSKDISKAYSTAEEIIKQINAKKGKQLGAVLAGSIARQTSLKGDTDLDIFILYPLSISRKDFEKESMKLAKEITKGHKQEVLYSEHPYLKTNINGFDIELVPAYKIKKIEEKASAVDRTPLHLNYIKEKLSNKQRDDVILFKKFLKGTEIYGADIKTEGVPGYLVELLILNYGSLRNTMQAVSKWKNIETIDIENHHKNSKDIEKKFKGSHLIVIDPTDKNRNVAAALSLEQYCRMIVACKSFLKKPEKGYFLPTKRKLWPISKVKKTLEDRKSYFLMVKMPYEKGIHTDIIFSQLRKSAKKIKEDFEKEFFRVMRADEYTDEEKNMCLIFELENKTIPKVTKHIGPYVTDHDNSEKFLAKHKKPISGPKIIGNRWAIEIDTGYFDAKIFLNDYLKKTKTKGGLPSNVTKALKKKHQLLELTQISNLAKKDKEFRLFLQKYVENKEVFL